MANWIGYMVSIKCGDDIGTFQGEILSATNTIITLTKAADSIVDLKLIDKQSDNSKEHSTVTIAKPLAKRAGRTQSTSESTNSNTNKIVYANLSHSRSKPIDIEVKSNANESLPSSHKANTPNKREKSKNRWGKSWKDEECFGSPLDHKISKDFDFEKNLALFNKQAIWDELNAQKPDVIKHADKKPTKYRHDENVIATLPTTYRQIIVPKQDFCEYVTDDGLIIPSISRSLRKKLWETAERVGLTWEKRIELVGRAAAEISIQLLGGGHRLNPHNTHQWPTVTVLCGPHKQGAAGINAARQLASHGVKTIVFTISMDAPVAPILALDPPPIGTPGINPKFSLLPVLPLPHTCNNGKLYLCNLGFPLDIFNEVGIKYKSPFGSKFVIPLHPKDD
ncbi:hypothetical protein NQ318_013254 [Aromia moschata]|uniref:Enhancer of mRNA-decapping protein 3 n=1 Tax=Aromia moschata TaxID=1265417 RepID=A0AAV8XS78_9CUCU|nr:hypothetical protein NQ318_013254 [Aromia moschata]